ncbi:hypothetical protein CHUAL_001500 [Chamberlinius hualienensis]
MVNKQGKCSGQLAERISKEDCCNGGDATTAWTAEDLESGRLFFWMALGGGVPNCVPCKDSCQNVRCPDGKKCVVRKGQPKCVCAPDCSKRKTKVQFVKKQLEVAYYGHCQKSCKFLNCPGNKQCLLDQNHNPHCVKCIRQCPETTNNHVCGVNNVTYNSICHLRQAACEKGYAIPLAYFGKCKAQATCENVKCGKRRKCLTNPSDNIPRCSSCRQFDCRTSRIKLEGPVCGSDNLTYPTWCHMMQQSCRSGIVIETKHNGACEGRKQCIWSRGNQLHPYVGRSGAGKHKESSAVVNEPQLANRSSFLSKMKTFGLTSTPIYNVTSAIKFLNADSQSMKKMVISGDGVQGKVSK